MIKPEIGSRWVHKEGRVVIVVGVRDASAMFPVQVDYRYVRTAGTEGLMRSRSTPTQTLSFDNWTRLFKPKETP